MATSKRLLAVAMLAVLAPVLAEYLQAYDESTGRPLILLGGLIVLVPLYGAPALLIRELARRRGLDWRGVALLATAAGFVQAGIIDQSLFIERYRGLDLIQQWSRATFVAPLGVSAFLALNYVGGHALYSFFAPIALTEGVVGDRRPWLGRAGIVVAILAWFGAALLVGLDNAAMNDEQASALELVVTSGLVVVLVALALRCRAGVVGRGPAVSAQVGLGFLAGTVYALVPPNWWGVALQAIGLGLTAVLLIRWARSPALAGLAFGLLLPRVLLAFGDAPLFGEPSMARQIGHHVTMLAVVLLVGALALRRRTGAAEAVESPGA